MKFRVLLTAAVAALTTFAGSASANSDSVKAAVEAWLNGRFKVQEVRKSPVPGIYEVRIGNDLLYAHEDGQYVFVEGQLIDMKSGVSLTRARLDEILRIDFKTLPLELAIKEVKGDGKRVFAIFEDPNCPYCRKLRTEMEQLSNVTIYTYAIPILSPDSERKVRAAWCAEDRVEAWNELLIHGTVPANDGKCDVPVPALLELSRKLGVTGTPTIFLTTGQRVPGAVPLQRLEQLLDAAARAS
ncbi:MAG: DsbC family protein [Burkholderiales bacterium]|nr:MAG: DsbC family protein [Burkholderiales bacterium]